MRVNSLVKNDAKIFGTASPDYRKKPSGFFTFFLDSDKNTTPPVDSDSIRIESQSKKRHRVSDLILIRGAVKLQDHNAGSTNSNTI